MQWLRANAVGLAGLLLALVAFAGGLEAYRAGVRRDEQSRMIPRRLERGESDLAEQHRKSVAVLSEYSNVTRSVAYSFAGFAAVVGAMHVKRPRPSMWLTAVLAVLVAGAVGLAYASRANPVPALAMARSPELAMRPTESLRLDKRDLRRIP
jgi:hypothetical protein